MRVWCVSVIVSCSLTTSHTDNNTTQHNTYTNKNSGVISGAMLPLRRAFALTESQQEIVVSTTVLAAFFSSLAGGSLNHALGRRHAILAAAAIFVLGSAILGISWNYESLVLGRMVVGVGIGIASLTTPIYIAEVAVPRMRGQLVTVNAFMV